MGVKMSFCRLLLGSLRPWSRLQPRSQFTAGRGAGNPWPPGTCVVKPRTGETLWRVETLRVGERWPPPRRLSHLRPGAASACSPAVRSCAWCPEQLGGRPRTSQRGILETGRSGVRAEKDLQTEQDAFKGHQLCRWSP